MTATPPPRQAKRGRPGYDLETLLNVAVRLFNERGYDGTSMEDLSRKLGITKSAIYYHVPSKEELLRLAVDRALDGLFAVADQVRVRDGRAIGQLEDLVRGSVKLLVRELPFVTLLLRVRGNTKVERAALARRRDFDRLVTDLVTRARDEGDLRADIDPATTSRLLFGMVNSLIEWYRPRGSADVDIAETIAAVAFDGLRVRRSDSPQAENA
ncbi:MAG TPA: TetR/AcrR family transcriptional regulator [Pseudonocardiaceae bacterium]|jgi:AcrR family transcriptional regulator